MKLHRHSSRRGLTLIELMLALVITAMIAGAIAAMMAAVTAGVVSKRDSRGVMLRANAAQARLMAYIASANCVLAAGADDVTIWYEDSRESDTVHATEVRWIQHDAEAGTMVVYYVAFPDTWTELEKDLVDVECPSDTDWDTLLVKYRAMNLVCSIELVDGLLSADIDLNDDEPMDARIVGFDLEFSTEEGPATVRCTAAVRYPSVPVS